MFQPLQAISIVAGKRRVVYQNRKIVFNVHVKKSLLDQYLIDGAIEKCFDDNSFLKDFIFFCSVQMYRISNLALEKKPAPFINTLARLVYNLFEI